MPPDVPSPTRVPSSSSPASSKSADVPRGALCIKCPAKATTSCGSCQTVFYCSEECKGSDIQHNIMCFWWPIFGPRPSDSYRRAILFPQHGDKPRIVWLDFWPNRTEFGTQYMVPLLSNWFDKRKKLEFHDLNTNYVLNRTLPRSIRVVMYPEGTPGVSLVNRSITTLTKSRFTRQIKGPVLAFGALLCEERIQNGLDLEFEDFQHIIDYLTICGTSALVNEIDRYWGSSVRGVRINCDGDRIQDFNTESPKPIGPQFEDVRIPSKHIAWTGKSLLPIPAALGIPILAATLPRRSTYETYYLAEYDLDNPGGPCRYDYSKAYRDLAQEWLIEPDPQYLPSNDHARTLAGAQPFYAGSMILVRQDEVPLTSVQVEALWNYLKYILKPRMIKEIDLKNRPASAYAQIEANSGDFAKFFQHGLAFIGARVEDNPSPLTSKKRKGSLKSIQSPTRRKMRYEWTSDGEATD